MEERLTDEQLSGIFRLALQEPGLIGEEDTAVLFHDLSLMAGRCRMLTESFPAQTQHRVAIKANPLVKVLREIKRLGLGAEAASLPELHLALEAGFAPRKVVFDSPVKTVSELEFAIKAGIHLNADSLTELRRIDEIMKRGAFPCTIGVRINPQVGTGLISQTSVAGDYSKFGVPLYPHRQELIDAFLHYPWLTGVHLHIGSQGCPLPLLVEGVRTIAAFICEVNHQLAAGGRPNRIDLVDIGGGLPVAYHRNMPVLSLGRYVQALQAACPELFSERFTLITEFGRYIQANAGWVASRVEYVKQDAQVNTVMIHVGADLFLRKCYRPTDWHHELTVLDSQGRIKRGLDSKEYTIAGPLCFAGDLIARQISLPPVEEGDYLLIHDAGAYTLGMWSRYNSRQVPKVIGYRQQDGIHFESLRQRETCEQLKEFWSK